MGNSNPQVRFEKVVAGFRAWVENARESGIDGFPQPRDSAVKVASPGREDKSPAAELVSIRQEIGDCQRCKLCEGRTNIVFGVGNPAAQVLFVGEGPGEDEDLKGEPFVGRAGQLLTGIIENGMGLRRGDVYIANVVKCRPPNNRNPAPDEIAACHPFLIRQIEAIRPRVIVALGKFAAQLLLETTTPISKLRGQWALYRGIKLMPTFHPSYLLRNPTDKKLVWRDIQQVMKEVGLEAPRKSR